MDGNYHIISDININTNNVKNTHVYKYNNISHSSHTRYMNSINILYYFIIYHLMICKTINKISLYNKICMHIVIIQ
ncbi:hypothetical protein PFFVO_02665 [Plasmodium falciparum Vietnam Oak-Knoll (FVO)]|uniref:Uncharacterized protein n=2 Tax=Plasmodium falciparum TaxID=5833 RepID=A0A024X8V9_PLAFC|nr:hypothetical protein PFFVO_02665 [Plasmodium falciparum Vietnam Oak-Knoll (FVO)]ETW61535.1 hypothetical protein PFMC_02626 [Plasmodium falciparum CAMP/Malaysia]